METKYIIYKTTNNINGKIYIGAHKTNDLEDDYLGSGKILQLAIKKYGKENFTREILVIFDNPIDMYEMESILVNGEFVKDQNTYNIKEGGHGGFDFLNSDDFNNPTHTIEHLTNMSIRGNENRLKKLKWLRENDIEWVENVKYKISMGLERFYQHGGCGGFKGKSHTEETKKKIGEANSKRQKGKNNSQYGTMWITNEVENKKIPKGSKIPKGWRKGRKMK